MVKCIKENSLIKTILIGVFMVGAFAANSAMAQSLTTMFAANNSFAGNTFDATVVGPQPVTINSFDVNLDTPGSTNTVAIYWRNGTSDGFQNNPAGWVLMGKDTNVISAGPDLPTPVNVGGLVMIPGQTYGIYVDLESYPSSAVQYTNGGPQAFNDGVLSLTTFTGQASPIHSGSFFPRIWNGTIYYTAFPDVPIPTLSSWTLLLLTLLIGMLGVAHTRIRSRNSI